MLLECRRFHSGQVNDVVSRLYSLPTDRVRQAVERTKPSTQLGITALAAIGHLSVHDFKSVTPKLFCIPDIGNLLSSIGKSLKERFVL